MSERVREIVRECSGSQLLFDIQTFFPFVSDQFSQLVWKSTRQFGCGKAKSSNGKVFVVGYYFPKGNEAGQFHLNVFPRN